MVFLVFPKIQKRKRNGSVLIIYLICREVVIHNNSCLRNVLTEQCVMYWILTFFPVMTFSRDCVGVNRQNLVNISLTVLLLLTHLLDFHYPYIFNDIMEFQANLQIFNINREVICWSNENICVVAVFSVCLTIFASSPLRKVNKMYWTYILTVGTHSKMN